MGQSNDGNPVFAQDPKLENVPLELRDANDDVIHEFMNFVPTPTG